MFFTRILGQVQGKQCKFLLLFYMIGHLHIMDYVKCLPNGLSWLRHDRMLEFSINCLTTDYYYYHYFYY